MEYREQIVKALYMHIQFATCSVLWQFTKWKTIATIDSRPPRRTAHNGMQKGNVAEMSDVQKYFAHPEAANSC